LQEEIIKNNKSNYNTAIIGCGRIASEFDDDTMLVGKFGTSSHAGAYIENENTLLIAAADLNKTKLKKFGARWKIERLYEDYKIMLDTEKIDILSICTPNTVRLEIIEKAINSGVKAIFCEKPIADSIINAEKMIKLARLSDVHLIINNRRRWDKRYQNIKRFIDSGEIGQIKQVSCYYVGGIANTGAHLFDLLRMLFGEIINISAWLNDSGDIIDPKMDGYIKFQNHVSVTLQSLDIEDYLVFELDIYGSKGRLRIENNGFNISFWKSDESQNYNNVNELNLSQVPFDYNFKPEMFKNAIIDIVNCLNTGNRPKCIGEDGLKALEIISAFHQSVKLNNQNITIPLKEKSQIIQSN